MGFTSSVYQKMDDKYRIRIPVKYKNALGNDFVFVAGDQPCISVYPRAAWDERVENMAAQVRESGGDPRKVKAMRRILRSVEDELKEDSQNRIIVSPALREHLKLKKGDRDLVTLGMRDHLEIWKTQELDAYEENMTVEEAYEEVNFFA